MGRRQTGRLASVQKRFFLASAILGDLIYFADHGSETIPSRHRQMRHQSQFFEESFQVSFDDLQRAQVVDGNE